MFMSKFLISCALIVAAQAGYAPGPVPGGYAAQIQPAATLSIGGYGGYGSAHGLDSDYGHGAINRNALNLASLALSLPSAGAPIPATIAYPNYPTTSYTAPALLAPASYGSTLNGAAEPATASTAAAAASNVAPNAPRTAYVPVSSYGSGSRY